MELVDPLQVLGLAEQHHVRVAARSHEREGAEQVAVGEIVARGDEFALVLGAAFVVEPSPCRIDLQERVLDEMADRHRQLDDTGQKLGSTNGLEHAEKRFR